MKENMETVAGEVEKDLFFSETNMAHLRRAVKALDEGKGVEHELIEE